MILAKWAKQHGLAYRTALKWYHEDGLPVKAYKLPSGAIWVEATVSEVAVEKCPRCGWVQPDPLPTDQDSEQSAGNE